MAVESKNSNTDGVFNVCKHKINDDYNIKREGYKNLYFSLSDKISILSRL